MKKECTDLPDFVVLGRSIEMMISKVNIKR